LYARCSSRSPLTRDADYVIEPHGRRIGTIARDLDLAEVPWAARRTTRRRFTTDLPRGDEVEMTIPACLRCDAVQLVRLPESSDEIEFFHCPSCHRPYAKRSGGSLTFRWLHPISLALYDVLFDDDPVSRADEVAWKHGGRMAARFASEIELELANPTQEVRAILDNPQSEEVCREFLREVAARIRSRMK
jgi:transposase-like protein